MKTSSILRAAAIAAGVPSNNGPEVLRPGQNKYSKDCDRNGGFGFGGF